MATERCLSFLDTAERINLAWVDQAGNLRQMVNAYAQPQGWAEVDRQQRLFEHGVANSVVSDDIAPLVDLCRQRYREVSWAIHERFWPVCRKRAGRLRGCCDKRKFSIATLPRPCKNAAKWLSFWPTLCASRWDATLL